jgi:hypothetical protein
MDVAVPALEARADEVVGAGEDEVRRRPRPSGRASRRLRVERARGEAGRERSVAYAAAPVASAIAIATPAATYGRRRAARRERAERQRCERIRERRIRQPEVEGRARDPVSGERVEEEPGRSGQAGERDERQPDGAADREQDVGAPPRRAALDVREETPGRRAA